MKTVANLKYDFVTIAWSGESLRDVVTAPILIREDAMHFKGVLPHDDLATWTHKMEDEVSCTCPVINCTSLPETMNRFIAVNQWVNLVQGRNKGGEECIPTSALYAQELSDGISAARCAYVKTNSSLLGKFCEAVGCPDLPIQPLGINESLPHSWQKWCEPYFVLGFLEKSEATARYIAQKRVVEMPAYYPPGTIATRGISPDLGTTYEMQNYSWHEIPNYETLLMYGIDMRNVLRLPEQVFDMNPKGRPVEWHELQSRLGEELVRTRIPGIVMNKNNTRPVVVQIGQYPTLYELYNGSFHIIPNMDTFYEYRMDFTEVIKISEQQFSLYPLGADIDLQEIQARMQALLPPPEELERMCKENNLFVDGFLTQVGLERPIYEYFNGSWHMIPDVNTFMLYGVEFSEVSRISDEAFRNCPVRDDVSYDELKGRMEGDQSPRQRRRVGSLTGAGAVRMMTGSGSLRGWSTADIDRRLRDRESERERERAREVYAFDMLTEQGRPDRALHDRRDKEMRKAAQVE
jgi:hypothetical protein